MSADLQAALDLHKGNKAAAARSLGMPVSTFKAAIDAKGITYTDPDEVLGRWCAEHNVPIDDVSGYWHKTEEMSVFVRRRADGVSYMDLRDEIIAEMKEHAPVYEPRGYAPGAENLLVIDPADVHIGKLSVPPETGAHYDIDEAVKRLSKGVAELLACAQPHGIGWILFVLGNDTLHTDTPRRTTTSGTPQDTSGQWHDAFTAAKRAYIAAIEAAAEIAPVHLVHCPSNHDFMSGFMLSDTLVSWFHNHPNVHADPRSVNMKHRKYLEFGRNLLAFTHGDGAKESDLPALAMREARESFARTDRTWIHCHHIHHKKRKVDGVQVEKDHIGATVIQSTAGIDREDAFFVECLRSPSEPDGWHDRNGFVGAVQAIEAFVYTPRTQKARFTCEV